MDTIHIIFAGYFTYPNSLMDRVFVKALEEIYGTVQIHIFRKHDDWVAHSDNFHGPGTIAYVFSTTSECFPTESEFWLAFHGRVNFFEKLINQGMRVIALATTEDFDGECEGMRRLPLDRMLYFKSQLPTFNYTRTCIRPGFWTSPWDTETLGESGRFLHSEENPPHLAYVANIRPHHKCQLYRDPDWFLTVCQKARWDLRIHTQPWEMDRQEYFEWMGKAAAVICPWSWSQLTWRMYEIPHLGGIPLMQRITSPVPAGFEFNQQLIPTYMNETELYAQLLRLKDPTYRQNLRFQINTWFNELFTDERMTAYYKEQILDWIRFYEVS